MIVIQVVIKFHPSCNIYFSVIKNIPVKCLILFTIIQLNIKHLKYMNKETGERRWHVRVLLSKITRLSLMS